MTTSMNVLLVPLDSVLLLMELHVWSAILLTVFLAMTRDFVMSVQVILLLKMDSVSAVLLITASLAVEMIPAVIALHPSASTLQLSILMNSVLLV